jgi:hypothetical protein
MQGDITGKFSNKGAWDMINRHEGKNGTWLDPEELCYPNGGMKRRCRAVNVVTKKLQTVRCSIPDTFFSIPVKGGGWVGQEDMEYQFHPKESQG